MDTVSTPSRPSDEAGRPEDEQTAVRLSAAKRPAADRPPGGRPAVVVAQRSRRRQRWLRLLGWAALVLVLLTPVFRYNALGAAETEAFNGWQLDSQALVIAKIESTTPQAKAPGIDALGLLVAVPDQNAPSATFDWLGSGAKPTTTSYAPYQSQIGFAGYLFTALYHLGFTTISSLQIVNSALFVAVLALFTLLLRRATSTSFAVLFAIATLGSPWLAEAGRNLYWVPWTWFLPACAALWFTMARGRTRWLAAAALAAAFLLKWASGYEFLTSVTLLAAAMPVLQRAFHPESRPVRAVLRDALAVVGIAVVGFVVSLLVLAFLVGAGNFAYGANVILFDAGKRTYGGVTVDDPLLAASIAANPLDVVATYLFSWNTDVFSFGTGTPLDLVIGPHGLWMLIIAAAVVVVARAVRGDRRWIRDLWVLGIALSVPISWFVAAKAHSYVHPFINFVLWYLITVGALLWILVDWVLPRLRGAAAALGEAVARMRSAA